MVTAVIAVGLPASASAGIILNAEVRITAEDNIVGLLSGGGDAADTGHGDGMMSASALQAGGSNFGSGPGSGPGGGSDHYTGSGSQSPGDISITTLTELGGSTNRGERLSFFAKGFAERTDYQNYSEYDLSVAGVGAGLTADLGDRFSMRLAGFDKIRRYDSDPGRDSTAYGGSIGLKQRFAAGFSLRQTAEFEANRAALQDFSYRGTTYRIRGGYDLTERVLVTAGYSMQTQHYQDVAATALRTGTASFGTDFALSRNWSTDLSYERQAARPGTSGVITRNNILSFGLRFSY